MGDVKRRVGNLEKRADLAVPRRAVVRDDLGHELWPMGRRADGPVFEIRVHGVDLERDI